MVELLVTLAVSGLTLAAVTRFFSSQVHYSRSHGFRLEAQQAMRSSLDAITRDLRLAGACLPSDGAFVSLEGTDDPAGDSISIRTGLVRVNMSCISTSTGIVAVAGARTLDVANGDGFAPDLLAYVKHPNGSGEFSMVTAADAVSVTIEDGLSQDYPAGSGVYAVDERIYEIDSTLDPPLLLLTVNRGEPQAFAAGVRNLQVEYILDRNCDPCDRVDLPSDTAEWWLVNSVELTTTVESVGATQPDDFVTLVASSTGKPRNLLP